MMNKMNDKICLILFAALIVLAVQSPDEKPKKNSLSEEVISERLRRSAYADPGRKRKARKSQKTNRTNKNMMKKANSKVQKKQK